MASCDTEGIPSTFKRPLICSGLQPSAKRASTKAAVSGVDTLGLGLKALLRLLLRLLVLMVALAGVGLQLAADDAGAAPHPSRNAAYGDTCAVLKPAPFQPMLPGWDLEKGAATGIMPVSRKTRRCRMATPEQSLLFSCVRNTPIVRSELTAVVRSLKVISQVFSCGFHALLLGCFVRDGPSVPVALRELARPVSDGQRTVWAALH